MAVKTSFGQAGTLIFDAVRLNAQTKNLPTLRSLMQLTTLLKWALVIWTLAKHNRYLYLKGCTLNIQTKKCTSKFHLCFFRTKWICHITHCLWQTVLINIALWYPHFKLSKSTSIHTHPEQYPQIFLFQNFEMPSRTDHIRPQNRIWNSHDQRIFAQSTIHKSSWYHSTWSHKLATNSRPKG